MMIVENQKQLIETTLVDNRRNVKESIELKEGLKIPMDIFRNYYNSFGFLYTNKDLDVLKNLQLENKFTGTYNFDVQIGKFVVEKDKPAILKIPNFKRDKMLCNIFAGFASKNYLDEYKIKVSLISKDKEFDNLNLITTKYYANDRHYFYIEIQSFNYDIDPDDLWIKFESLYSYLKFGILAFGVREISPIIPE